MQNAIIYAKTLDELDHKIQIEIDTGFCPNLGFVFASDALLDPKIPEIFSQHNIETFGTSSREEIAGGNLISDSVTALLLELQPELYQLDRFELKDGDSRALGSELADWASNQFTNPALLLLVGGAGFTVNSDHMLEGLFATTPGMPVFGGLASIREFEGRAFVFDNEGILKDGVIGLVFDRDAVDIQGIAISGWIEIGTPKRITKSEGNVVHEIENMPATFLYEKYFQAGPNVGSEDMFALMEYPLQVELADGSKVMRVPISMDQENKSIVFAGPIPQDSIVRFCSPNIAETIRHTVDEIQSFQAEEVPAGADAILLFDCAIRSLSFGSYMQKEIDLIQQVWQAPLVGFSSWGEIGNRRGERCNLHNTTLSIVLLRDKNSATRRGTRFSDDQMMSLIEAAPDKSDPKALRQEVQDLRKQKIMLSNFLALNSDDLDAANQTIAQEKAKSENLLLNVLPAPIADRLKGGEQTIADNFDDVSILFADLVGFTNLSSHKKAKDIVKILNRLFINFDALALKYGAEKIKTIGDAYMAVTGLPEVNPMHATHIVKLARSMLRIIKLYNRRYGTDLNLRIGINSGPVVAGVIGRNKFTYDLWGDTVNVASRMESSGVAGRIQVSESTYTKASNNFAFESRGEIDIKGKGQMITYLLKD